MTLSEMSGATFSEDRVYRRLLWRVWDKALPICTLAMLNPSTANENKGDPTVTRQIERAKRLGCGTLLVVNAFDVVATDPAEMLMHPKPNTLENDESIFDAVTKAVESGGIAIAAWGPKAEHRRRDTFLLDMLSGIQLHALRITKDGFPSHPLYLPYSAFPIKYPA